MATDPNHEELKSRVARLEADRDRTAERIADLERRVKELETVVRTLTGASTVRKENPQDRRAVTEKVQFDWQG